MHGAGARACNAVAEGFCSRLLETLNSFCLIRLDITILELPRNDTNLQRCIPLLVRLISVPDNVHH